MKRRTFLKLVGATVATLAAAKVLEGIAEARNSLGGELSLPASFPIAFDHKRPLPIFFTYAPLVKNGN